MHNVSITPPDAVVCLRIWDFAGLIEYQKTEVDGKGDLSMEEYYRETVDKWLKTGKWEERLNSTTWPFVVIDLFQAYIGGIFDVMVPLETDKDEEETSSDPLLLRALKHDESDYKLKILNEILLPKLKETNATVEEICNALERNFRAWYSLNVTTATSGEDIAFDLTLVSGDHVCYKLFLSGVELSAVSSVTIEIDANKLDFSDDYDDRKFTTEYYYNDDYMTKFFIDYTAYDEDGYCGNAKNFGFGSDAQAQISLDFSGRLIEHSSATINRRLSFLFKIAYLKVLKFSPTERYIVDNDRCSANVSADQCRHLCRLHSLERRCNCSLDFVSENGRFPTLDEAIDRRCRPVQLEKCVGKFIDADDHDCREACPNRCEVTLFTIEEGVSPLFLPSAGNKSEYKTARIELIFGKGDYMVFTEFTDWSAQRIVGSVGGAMGLWLGLDVIVVIFAIITFPLLFLLQKIEQDRVKKEELTLVIELSCACKETSAITTATTDHKAPLTSFLGVFKAEVTEMLFDDVFKGALTTASKFALGRILLKKLTFFILFVLGAYFSFRMFLDLVQQYNEGGTESRLTIVISTEAKLPPAAVCLPIDHRMNGRIFFFCNFGEISPLDSPDDFRADTFADCENGNIRNFQSSFETKEAFLNTTSWSWADRPGIFFMLYLYLRQNFYHTTKSLSSSLALNVTEEDRNILHFMHTQFKETWNITSYDVQERFSKEALKIWFNPINVECHSVGSNLQSSPPAKSTTVINWSHVTFETMPVEMAHLFHHLLCAHLPWENFAFLSAIDYCSIHMRSNNYKTDFDVEHCNSRLDDTVFPYLALKSATEYEYSQRALLFHSRTYSRTTAFVSQSVVYSNLVDDSVCSLKTDVPPLVCHEQCRQKLVRDLDDHCNRNKSVGKVFNWTAYSECLAAKATEIDWQEDCQRQCLKPCVEAVIKFDTRLQASLNAVLNETTHLSFDVFIGDFMYPHMSEKLLWTRGNFLAASGGLLGFLLGLDVTFLVSFFFTPAMFLIGCKLKADASKFASITVTTVAVIQETDENSVSKNFLQRWKDIILKQSGITADMSRALKVKAIFELVFWLVVRLAFVVITAILCVDFVHQLNETYIGGQFRPMQNSSITLPKISLCLPLSPAEFVAFSGNQWIDKMLTIGHDEWISWSLYNESRSDDYDYSNHPYLVHSAIRQVKTFDQLNIEEIDYNFANSITATGAIFLLENSSWSGSIIRLVHRYLAVKMAYKALPNVAFRSGLHDNDMDSTDIPQLRPSVDVFGGKVDGVDDERLLQQFGDHLQRQFNLVTIARYSTSKRNNIAKGHENIEIYRTTFLSLTTICFMLPEITMSNVHDSIIITIDKSALPNKRLSILHAMECNFECPSKGRPNNYCKSVGSLDLLGRETNAEEDSYVFLKPKISAGVRSLTDVSVAAVFDIQPIADKEEGRQRCVPKNARDDCLRECRRTKVEEICKCEMSSSDRKIHSVFSCSWKSASECMRGNSSSHLLSLAIMKCTNQCKPSCQQLRFDVTMIEETDIKLCTPNLNWGMFSWWLTTPMYYTDYSYKTDIELVITSFQYRLYAEALPWTFWSVTEQLGGILGLLLGLDVPFFVDCLLAFLNGVFRALSRRSIC